MTRPVPPLPLPLPLIVIRPEPGCAETVAAATALGLAVYGFPLFAVAPVAWDAPPAAAFDALLIGSGNAVRHAGPALADYAGLPVYAVGARTAAAARAQRLPVAATGAGGLAAMLAALAPGHRRLLRLAGAERVALSPPPGVAITDRVVYASTPLPLPGALALLLRAAALPGAVVALHSAAAAAHVAGEADRCALPRARIALAALGPRVLAAAGGGWAAAAAADAPTDSGLLALAARMCQSGGR